MWTKATALSMPPIYAIVCNAPCKNVNVSTNNSSDNALVQPPNRFAWQLIILGIIGWIGAVTLTLERIHLWISPNDALSCDVSSFISCKSVMLQKQAAIFGFPNSFVGIIAFLAPIALGIASLLGYRYGAAIWRVFFAGIGMGFVFSLWLFSQSVFVIGVLCPYCIVVWIGMLPLFFKVYSFGILEGFLEAPKALVARAAGFYETAWIWALSLELIILATIILRFLSQWKTLFIGLSQGS